jgi:hypothetical protein
VIHLRETCCCSTNLCTWRPNTVYKDRSVRRHQLHKRLIYLLVVHNGSANAVRSDLGGLLVCRQCLFEAVSPIGKLPHVLPIVRKGDEHGGVVNREADMASDCGDVFSMVVGVAYLARIVIYPSLTGEGAPLDAWGIPSWWELQNFGRGRSSSGTRRLGLLGAP